MSVFDDPSLKKHLNTSWVNGFETENVEKPDYAKMFLATEEEKKASLEKYLDRYDKAVDEFKNKTSLTSWDMDILIVAAALQTIRWYFISNDKFRFDKASDADKFFEKTGENLENLPFVPATIPQLLSDHTVPYDAIKHSERFDKIYPNEKIVSGFDHRYKTLGHDPLAGLIFGTANIATNTLTVNNFSEMFPSYHVLNQQINGKTDIFHILKWTGELMMNKPEVVGAAFAKQIFHCGTDAFTKQGLPVPVINVISPETSKFLIGNQIDTYSVTRSAMLAIFINKIVEMCHRMYFDKNSDDARLYEVRTRKILTYSNTMSSILNVGYVGVTRNFKKFDLGGILVTLWRILNNKKEIEKIRWEFIQKTLDGELKKEEDEVNEKLAKWGYRI